jgi:hypothetical protein
VFGTRQSIPRLKRRLSATDDVNAESTGIDPMGKKPRSHQESRNSCPVFC